MSYEKQTWVDGETVIDAEHMNHIEESLGYCNETIDKFFSGGSSDAPGEETLSQGRMVINNGYTGVNEASDAHMSIRVTRGRTIRVENAYCAYSRCICAYDSSGTFLRVLATNTGTDPVTLTFKVDDFDMISVTSKAGESIKVTYVDAEMNNDFIQSVIVKMRQSSSFSEIVTSPICCIIDDDTTSSAYAETFASLMEQNGISGTYACITSRFEADTALKDTLLKMEQRGHQVVLHCYKQIDEYQTTASIGDTAYKACESDFVHGLRDLQSAGFANCKFWVVPFGRSNAPLQAIAQKWGMECLVKSASTDYNGIDGAHTRWELSRNGLNPTDSGALTQEQLLTLADRCATVKGMLLINTHIFDGWGSDFTRINDFISHCKDKGYQFMTLGQAWSLRRPIYDWYSMLK